MTSAGRSFLPGSCRVRLRLPKVKAQTSPRRMAWSHSRPVRGVTAHPSHRAQAERYECETGREELLAMTSSYHPLLELLHLHDARTRICSRPSAWPSGVDAGGPRYWGYEERERKGGEIVHMNTKWEAYDKLYSTKNTEVKYVQGRTHVFRVPLSWTCENALHYLFFFLEDLTAAKVFDYLEFYVGQGAECETTTRGFSVVE